MRDRVLCCSENSIRFLQLYHSWPERSSVVRKTHNKNCLQMCCSTCSPGSSGGVESADSTEWSDALVKEEAEMAMSSSHEEVELGFWACQGFSGWLQEEVGMVWMWTSHQFGMDEVVLLVICASASSWAIMAAFLDACEIALGWTLWRGICRLLRRIYRWLDIKK